MSPGVEILLVLFGLVGVLFATILLTNGEWDRFGEWDELERRRELNAVMDRNPAGKAEQ